MSATGLMIWPPPGKSGAGSRAYSVVVAELFVLQQRHGGGGHLAQVVAGDLGGQADGNAAERR
jgi:hypothetical protein